jgi:multidrug efflux pump subunit AcrA (membrane-fusion protein)
MFVKATRVTSGGRQLTYLQLVESYREGGRVRQRVIAKLGREDELDPAAIARLVRSLAKYTDVDVGAGNVLDDVELLPGFAYGHVFALEHVWNDLALGDIVGDLAAERRFRFDVVNVIKAIVFQRVLDPGSERSLVRSFLPSVFAPEFDGIELQHAYRALQFLAEVGPELEARLTRVMTEKLFADASLVLFDTTSTYFEGAGPEELASFGFSRDKRGDRPQANLALLTSREGLPLGHWLYPGKQSDVRSMAEASREFRDRLGLGSFVVVADRGMVSTANLQALQDEKIEYVIAERLRRSTANAALARAGRYKRVSRNLEVKEIKTEGAERVLVCRNSERAAEDARQRDAIVQQLQAKIAAGGVRDQLKNGARRYLKLTGATPEIDLKKVQEDARYDGKWVLRTTTSLPPEQVALAYRGLWRVENAFRTLKTPLELRPLFHTSEAGIRGHVQACVLAYGLVRMIEDRLDTADLDLNAKEALQELARIQRAPLYRAGVTVTKTSTPTEQQQRLLTAIGAPIPERHAAV